MLDLIRELYLTNRGYVTDDYDACLAYIDERELPLTIHEYPSGTVVWDSWVVPRKWSVDHGYVETVDGERILDFADHPLHLISYSASFEGRVSRDELSEHLHTHPTLRAAIPWHFRLNYRPWDSEWGFCATQEFAESLSNDEYVVSIRTRFEDGTMKVAEHHLPGRSDETVVFVAHLDHTGMANDDLSGVAVGIELMRRLAEREDRTYSYKLLLVPELLGSAAYLASHESEAADFAYGFFLEMLGNDNRLCLQRSFEATTKLDRVAEHVLRTRFDDYDVKAFRRSIGNDELIFDSPGYEIPTISVSRFPYPEYHTSLDDPSLLSEDRLETAVEYVLDVVDVLERDFVPCRTFVGVPSLANPKYDLYIDPGQPALAGTAGIEENLEVFRDYVFRYLGGEHSVFDIAERFDLDFDVVYGYLSSFVETGLAERFEATLDGKVSHSESDMSQGGRHAPPVSK